MSSIYQNEIQDKCKFLINKYNIVNKKKAI